MKKSLEDRVGTILGVLFVLVYALIMGLAVAVSIYLDGMGFKSLFLLVGWLVSTCFLWFIPSIFQKFSKKKEVLRDERDVIVLKNSALAALAVSCLYFFSACFLAWRIVGSNGSVSVNVITLIFVGWIVIFQFTIVFSNLIQNRSGGKDGKKQFTQPA
jgi:hypothetical protein